MLWLSEEKYSSRLSHDSSHQLIVDFLAAIFYCHPVDAVQLHFAEIACWCFKGMKYHTYEVSQASLRQEGTFSDFTCTLYGVIGKTMTCVFIFEKED